MARQRQGPAKRVSAADKAKKKQIADLEAKLKKEGRETNALGQRQNELETELAQVVQEITIKRGRCSILAEQLMELGVKKIEIPLSEEPKGE